jgi:hypothetical protein
MITRLSLVGSCVYVHAGEISIKTTKAFTHGGLVFDQNARLATFGKLPPVALPEGLMLSDGDTLELQLVAPDGTLRKQARAGILKLSPKEPGILRIAGMAKTPRKFPTEDGWGIAIYKYRAYFSHPGVPTDPEIPEWLKASIARQRSLWNRLAYFCREARRKCSPAPTAEIVAFVRETILPEIDAFNDALGRSKAKIKHPAKLKTEMPGPDGLWNFVGQLRTRIEKGRAVPEGLLEKIIVFAEQFKPDYTPLNEFLNNYHNIAAKEATDLGLLRYEIRPTVSGFKAVLDRRKTTKAAWSEGWPLIKYPDSPKAANWGVHYYFNTAGLDSAQIESPKGVPGLTLGPHLKPSDTGHELLTGLAATKRSLRAAEISISGPNHEQCTFRFGVLYHRPLPAGSHLKEWKLIYADGALWLCLTVELQHPVPVHSPLAAGLDVGWRRTEEGLRFGTLYEPATMSFRELSIDMQKSPKDHKDRMPFRIDIGPTRWEKRNILQLLPDWKPGNPIPSSFETRTAMQSRRDYYKDTAKILLRKHLGESMPAWIDKAGRRGLLKLVEEFKEDEVVQNILGTWKQQDVQVGKLVSMYLARSTKRLEYGQAQVAHDVCRYLHDKGVHRLIVEISFLAKVSQRHDNEDSEGLKRSQKYRQFAAVGKFVAVIKNTAIKYGIVVEELSAINTTRICQYCNHLNPGTEKEHFTCEKCERQIKQDHNAAVNISRFGCDPELAEMAASAG